jgi:hypothetical protein
MIEELKKIEKTVLMDLLKNPSIWNTLDINYHHPRVERLWTQIGDSRLMLHVIHPCETSDALYHPHPWPSAMHVLSGTYETAYAVRYKPSDKELRNFEWKKYPISPSIKILDRTDEKGNKIVLKELSRLIMTGDIFIEMLEVLGWHYVRPIGGPCLSMMLIDKPWDVKDDQDIPKSWGKLPILTEERKLEILLKVRTEIEVKLKIYG